MISIPLDMIKTDVFFKKSNLVPTISSLRLPLEEETLVNADHVASTFWEPLRYPLLVGGGFIPYLRRVAVLQLKNHKSKFSSNYIVTFLRTKTSVFKKWQAFYTIT